MQPANRTLFGKSLEPVVDQRAGAAFLASSQKVARILLLQGRRDRVFPDGARVRE